MVNQKAALPPILLLMLISMVGPIGINIMMPAMPEIRYQFGTDHSALQTLIAVYIVSIGAFQIVMGPISDRIGRKPTILIGLGLYAVSAIACAYAQEFWQLVMLRILQGMGGSVSIMVVRAIVRDVFDRENTAATIGYITMGMAVGPMFAPAIGGQLIIYFSWQGIFIALAGFAIATALLCVRYLRDRKSVV